MSELEESSTESLKTEEQRWKKNPITTSKDCSTNVKGKIYAYWECLKEKERNGRTI